MYDIDEFFVASKDIQELLLKTINSKQLIQDLLISLEKSLLSNFENIIASECFIFGYHSDSFSIYISI